MRLKYSTVLHRHNVVTCFKIAYYKGLHLNLQHIRSLYLKTERSSVRNLGNLRLASSTFQDHGPPKPETGKGKVVSSS